MIVLRGDYLKSDGSDLHLAPRGSAKDRCGLCGYNRSGCGDDWPHRLHPNGGWEVAREALVYVPPPVSVEAAYELIRVAGEARPQ